MNKIQVLTAFPEFLSRIKDYSIVKRAIEKKKVNIDIFDLRKWGIGKYKQIDDKPYGGGAGMLLMVEPIYNALHDIKKRGTKVIMTSAKGKKLDYNKCLELSKQKKFLILCGHYEGVDHRVHEHLVDEIISVGDYILSGGEIAAMVIIDSVVRLINGVINERSLYEETNNENIEYPNYTRPQNFNGWKVPEVLINGNHKLINEWKNLNKLSKSVD